MPGLAGYEAVPRYAEFIYRLLGKDVEFVPPGIILEIDRAEWAFLKRERRWTTGVIQIAASVGNVGRVQVLNPIGSDRIVVVQGCKVIQKTTLGKIRLGIDAAAAATPTPNIGLDTRGTIDLLGQVSVASKNLISNANPTISGYIIEDFTAQANSDAASLVLPAEAEVVTPGHNLTAFNTTVNELFTCVMWGYERPARPEEINA